MNRHCSISGDRIVVHGVEEIFFQRNNNIIRAVSVCCLVLYSALAVSIRCDKSVLAAELDADYLQMILNCIGIIGIAFLILGFKVEEIVSYAEVVHLRVVVDAAADFIAHVDVIIRILDVCVSCLTPVFLP